ncbi:MAG: response regulator transcription factor [Bacteroidales bacterium]|nr:response regulator transcription factor [Bacteroidales bacterium]
MIKVIAIDDEPLALLQLQKMIESTPYLTLVAACSDAFEAMRVMQENEVDAIFADINMPDLSGLDFVRSLSHPPIVVFTTAYSRYAIDAYKVNAIDYLLKPFGQPEFQRAAAKVKQQYDLLQAAQSSGSANANSANTSSAYDASDNVEGMKVKGDEVTLADESTTISDNNTERIEGDILFVKVDYRIVRISISDITYIESQSEYLKLHMASGPSLMVLMSIKRMADLLPVNSFVRIHRSYIVNMRHVVDIARLRVRMDADTILPIGESYKDNALRFVNARLVGK